MDHPVALAIDAQGRIFYTEKDTGRVRLIVNGQLQPQAVITVPVRTVGEAGLIGIAFDPDYALNHFMYIYHTSPDPVENRIVRFKEVDGVALNPTIVYTFPHQARSWDMHIGGNLHFGPDGSIYYIEGGGWSNGTLHRLWSASVSIVKFNDPYGAVQPGQRITYTISYANTGSDPLTDMIITDTVPSGTILDPASVYPTATVVADLIYWPLPTLMPGASQQVGFSILLPSPTATPVETPSPPSSMARSPSPLVDTPTPVAGCPANAQVCNLAWIYTDQTGRWQPSNLVYNPSERYYMPLALKSP